MAGICFSTRLSGEATSGLWEPRTLLLLLFVCVVDAAYMLSMYQVHTVERSVIEALVFDTDRNQSMQCVTGSVPDLPGLGVRSETRRWHRRVCYLRRGLLR